MKRRPPRTTRMTHSFPTRRSSDLRREAYVPPSHRETRIHAPVTGSRERPGPEQELFTMDLTQRLCDPTTGTLELFAVHPGRESGLYDALDPPRHAPPTRLAAPAGTPARSAHRWPDPPPDAGLPPLLPGAD